VDSGDDGKRAHAILPPMRVPPDGTAANPRCLSSNRRRKSRAFEYCTAANHCTAFFVPPDQAFDAVMPATHDVGRDFCLHGLQGASVQPVLLLASRHINKGGYVCGPYLETRNAGGIRRIPFCRRDSPWGILSSSGRNAKTKIAGQPAMSLNTGERGSPVFCFYAATVAFAARGS
jgi:hypothetical protein